MRTTWELKPFESCIAPVKYPPKIQRKDFLASGKFPVVSQEAEFTNGWWDDETDLFRASSPVVIFGDHTRVLKYVDFDFVLGADGVKILQPRPFLRPRYFFYQLMAIELPSLGYSRHYRLLKELTIRVPDLPEQDRIVAVLDEAFAGLAVAKANAEKNLQNARALFESHLDALLALGAQDWGRRSLGTLCEIARGGSPRPIKKYLTSAAGGINWIKIGDATASGKYIYRTEEKIRPEGARRSRVVHEGDFLLSNSMSFGRPYILRTTGCVHDGWLVLSGYAGELDQDYLYYTLGSRFVFEQFDRLAAGSTVRNLNIDLAGRVAIPVPPLEQQRSIAESLASLSDETQRLEGVYRRKLVAFEALKKSLLHQAFTGNLT